MELSETKMALINNFTEMAKGKSSDELLPLFLATSQKAKQMNITFSKEETLYLVNQLKSGLSESEQHRIDMLVNLMTNV